MNVEILRTARKKPGGFPVAMETERDITEPEETNGQAWSIFFFALSGSLPEKPWYTACMRIARDGSRIRRGNGVPTEGKGSTRQEMSDLGC